FDGSIGGRVKDRLVGRRVVRNVAAADLHFGELRVRRLIRGDRVRRERRDGATAMPQRGQATQDMAVYGTGSSWIGRKRAYEQDFHAPFPARQDTVAKVPSVSSSPSSAVQRKRGC